MEPTFQPKKVTAWTLPGMVLKFLGAAALLLGFAWSTSQGRLLVGLFLAFIATAVVAGLVVAKARRKFRRRGEHDYWGR